MVPTTLPPSCTYMCITSPSVFFWASALFFSLKSKICSCVCWPFNGLTSLTYQAPFHGFLFLQREPMKNNTKVAKHFLYVLFFFPLSSSSHQSASSKTFFLCASIHLPVFFIKVTDRPCLARQSYVSNKCIKNLDLNYKEKLEDEPTKDELDSRGDRC